MQVNISNLLPKTQEYLNNEAAMAGVGVETLMGRFLNEVVLGKAYNQTVDQEADELSPDPDLLEMYPTREAVLELLKGMGAAIEAEPSPRTDYYRLGMPLPKTGSTYLHQTGRGCRLDATGELADFFRKVAPPTLDKGRYPGWRGRELKQLLHALESLLRKKKK